MKKFPRAAGGIKNRKGSLKRIGMAGFLFFLIKGLAWLAVAGLIAWKSG